MVLWDVETENMQDMDGFRTISWGKGCEQSTGFVALPEVPYVQTHPKTWEIWNVYVFTHVRELIGIYCIYIYIHNGDEGYLQREGYLQKI